MEVKLSAELGVINHKNITKFAHTPHSNVMIFDD